MRRRLFTDKFGDTYVGIEHTRRWAIHGLGTVDGKTAALRVTFLVFRI